MPKTELTKEEEIKLKEIMSTARTQLEGTGKVMPEGRGALEQYPGSNPIGYYSEIDMGFSERMKRCENAVRLRNPLSWELYQVIKGRIEASQGYKDMKKEMMDISKKLRETERALRLCKDEKLSKVLEDRRKNLQNSPVLKDCDMTLRIMEDYSGARLWPIKLDIGLKEKHQAQYDTATFCRNKFGVRIGSELQYDPIDGMLDFHNPKSLEIEFENFDDIMMHQRMASEKNLGKTWEEVENTPLEPEEFKEYASSMPAYMQASCDRVLDSAVPTVKERADNIFIEGVSIREKMKNEAKIENPTEEQIKKYSSLYVAAALRNGSYVEAFTRDYKSGDKYNYKPVPITVKGDDSYIMKKDGKNESENITVSFLDRILAKLGFSSYKEKVEKASRAEKITQSRERFRNAHEKDMKDPIRKNEMEERKKAFAAVHKYKDRFLKHHDSNLSYSMIQVALDRQFFPNGKKDITNKATGYVRTNEREEMRSLAIAHMLKKGYSLEQILDITQHENDRMQAGKSVEEEMENCDKKTFYERHLETSEILQNAIEEYAKKHNISFKNPESVFGYPAVALRDIAVGAGNIVDIFLKDTHKKEVEAIFGKGCVNDIDKKTDGAITIGMLQTTYAASIEKYTRLAEGHFLNDGDYERAVKCEMMTKIFAKMEEKTGKVFAPESAMMEMEAIHSMLMCHPKVEAYYKNASPEELMEMVTKGKILEELNIDFEILPSKMMPNKPLESYTFGKDLQLGEWVAEVSIVPTVDGSSEFYEMTDPEVVKERAEQLEMEQEKSM